MMEELTAEDRQELTALATMSWSKDRCSLMTSEEACLYKLGGAPRSYKWTTHWIAGGVVLSTLKLLDDDGGNEATEADSTRTHWDAARDCRTATNSALISFTLRSKDAIASLSRVRTIRIVGGVLFPIETSKRRARLSDTSFTIWLTPPRKSSIVVLSSRGCFR